MWRVAGECVVDTIGKLLDFGKGGNRVVELAVKYGLCNILLFVLCVVV